MRVARQGHKALALGLGGRVDGLAVGRIAIPGIKVVGDLRVGFGVKQSGLGRSQRRGARRKTGRFGPQVV